METRRRFVGVQEKFYEPKEPEFKQDSDDEYLYDEKIWKVYEESDDDEQSRQKYRRMRMQKKRSISSNGSIVLMLVAMVIMTYSINIYSYREVQKIKADMGHDVKKQHPEVWWHKGLMYYIHPRSFQDSNGDGIGDIKGILQHIDHLVYLRVNAVILGSITKSSQRDPGRDILNFQEIDPQYGTLEDLQLLIKALHEKGIKLILEVIPNQTSDKHRWFQESRQVDSKYRDYYVWHPGKVLENGTKVPPSNWLSRYGGSAWEWDELRSEYYLHQMAPHMPDLNHRHPQLRHEFVKIMSFWLDQGIDGMRMEGVHAIFELDDVTMDEPPNFLRPEMTHPLEFDYLEHEYVDDQPEVHEFMASWRELFEDYAAATRPNKLFLSVDLEDDAVSDVIKYYETGADAPTNYFLTQVSGDCDARCIHELVDAWMFEIPQGKVSLWAMSSQEHGRMVSRRGVMYAPALAALHLLLPGAALIYYGDEIGMQNVPLSVQQMMDVKYKHTNEDLYLKHSRDPYRTPMQWSSEKNSGFSTSDNPWLPVHPDYRQTNKEKLLLDENNSSILHLYRKLAVLRQEPTFDHGELKFASTGDHIFSFIRFSGGSSQYLIALNFGSAPATDDYCAHTGNDIGKVTLYAPGLSELRNPKLIEGKTVEMDSITLYPGDALVLQMIAEDDIQMDN